MSIREKPQIKEELSFGEILNSAPENKTIQEALGKCYHLVKNHDHIIASISGGSDSDIMLDMLIRCGGADKTKFVFFNTGLEYEATKRHIQDLNALYGIQIIDTPPRKPIPICVKEFGVPFWSKHVSEMMQRLQRHNFNWEDKTYEELIEKYPNCKSAIAWWCNKNGVDGRKSPYNINRVSCLKEYITSNPPDFKISNKCCHFAKKLPAKMFMNSNECDLNCIGIRRAEGGVRQTRYTSCYSASISLNPDEYRPLFWMSDDDKKEYKKHYEISYSDCYEIWGMQRTGCAGCPYAQNFEQELELAKEYEPKFYKAMMSVFGDSYNYTRRFLEFRKNIKLDGGINAETD